MFDREDLKGLTRRELEDTLLKLSETFYGIGCEIERLLYRKSKEKHFAYELKIRRLEQEKESLIEELKTKHKTNSEQELFSKMNFDEKIKYLSKVREINEVYEEEDKLFKAEEKAFKRKYPNG